MFVVNKISWISVLKGFNILLVLCVHDFLVDKSTGNNHLFLSGLKLFFEPWFMVLFLFTSGFLLYSSRISKSYSIKKFYIDKIKRIIVPFVFFVNIFYLSKIIMAPFVKSIVPFSLKEYLISFIFYEGHSSELLWFLPILFESMLLYPLYLWLEKNNVRMILFLLILVGFYFIDFSSIYDYNYFYILNLNHYLIFFFIGIMVCKYHLQRYLDNILVFVCMVISYCIFYYLTDFYFVKQILGIFMSVSLCMLVSKVLPSLFSSFRDYIYQIYLMSLFFQAFVEVILWNKLFYNESLFYLFFALNFLAGLYGPVLIAKCVEKIPYAGIRTCFGLK